jgi:predicted component of type VI protein secretion system
MALKWGAIVVAVVSITLFASSNIIVGLLNERDLPVAFNLATIAAATAGVVVAVLAELYNRITVRLNALAEFVAARLNEVDAHTGDRNAGFVEGYMLSHGEEAGAIVPFASRSARRSAYDD